MHLFTYTNPANACLYTAWHAPWFMTRVSGAQLCTALLIVSLSEAPEIVWE